MLDEMPSTVFDEWAEYSDLEPFGQPWQNWLMAVQAWQFACAHTKSTATKPKFKNFFYESEQDRQIRKSAETKEFFHWLDAKAKH